MLHYNKTPSFWLGRISSRKKTSPKIPRCFVIYFTAETPPQKKKEKHLPALVLHSFRQIRCVSASPVPCVAVGGAQQRGVVARLPFTKGNGWMDGSQKKNASASCVVFNGLEKKNTRKSGCFWTFSVKNHQASQNIHQERLGLRHLGLRWGWVPPLSLEGSLLRAKKNMPVKGHLKNGQESSNPPKINTHLVFWPDLGMPLFCFFWSFLLTNWATVSVSGA